MTAPTEATRPIQVQTRYERFPASLKGAFVIRGADGNPHAVRIEWAKVARLPDGPARPAPVESQQLDVAPTRDLFVPFEIPVADLDPAWYAIASSVQVDGGRSFAFWGRGFSIPWPRNDVRRGVVHLGAAVRVGREEYVLDRVEFGGDAAVVVWRQGNPEEPDAPSESGGEDAAGAEAMILADGHALEVLPRDRGIRLYETRLSGERRTVSYPAPRSARSLAVVIALSAGGTSRPVELPPR